MPEKPLPSSTLWPKNVDVAKLMPRRGLTKRFKRWPPVIRVIILLSCLRKAMLSYKTRPASNAYIRGTNYEVKAVRAELKLHAVIMPREAKSHSERRRRVSIPQRASNDKVLETGSGTSVAMVEIVTAGAILSEESI